MLNLNSLISCTVMQVYRLCQNYLQTPHAIRLKVDLSFNSVTQLKLRLPDANHPILKFDLWLRVTRNESAQTKKTHKTLLYLIKTSSCICVRFRFPVTQQEWTFTWRWSWHNWFRFFIFFNWRSTWVFIFIVWDLISFTCEYRDDRHMVFISNS